MTELLYMIMGVILWECIKWYWRNDFFNVRNIH